MCTKGVSAFYKTNTNPLLHTNSKYFPRKKRGKEEVVSTPINFTFILSAKNVHLFLIKNTIFNIPLKCYVPFNLKEHLKNVLRLKLFKKLERSASVKKFDVLIKRVQFKIQIDF